MTAASLKVRLNNGLDIPVLGMGLGVGRDPNALATAKDWILSALKNGALHMDTSRYYRTEKAIGEAIRESGIPREEIWVTTKLPSYNHGRIREALEESLEALGLEYIDMYLIHWPTSFEYDSPKLFPPNPDGSLRFDEKLTVDVVWKGMEKLLDTGKTQSGYLFRVYLSPQGCFMKLDLKLERPRFNTAFRGKGVMEISGCKGLWWIFE